MCQTTGVEVEALESRTHLAAAPLLRDYEPLIGGSQWVYNVVDDGKRKVETETTSDRMFRMHGQSVFERRTYDTDHLSRDYENYSASGQIQLHRIADAESSLGFTPPILFPKLARAGQRTVTNGKPDMILFNRQIPGEFHTEIVVLGTERVKVPAGTFSTVKVQLKIELTGEYHKRGVDISIRFTDTQTNWMARGVGTVKATEVSRSETTINGKHKVENGTSRSVLKSYSIVH